MREKIYTGINDFAGWWCISDDKTIELPLSKINKTSKVMQCNRK